MKEDKKLLPRLRFPEFQDAGNWTADGLVTVADFINEKIALEQVALRNYVSTENILADYGGIDTGHSEAMQINFAASRK